jgi:three-Cys-motif partner protein
MKKNGFNPIIPVENDDLFLPEVGSWSDEKYKLVGGYCQIFTLGMKNLWDKLVYIDLFAGAGYSKIKGTAKIRMSSALIALSISHKFDKYIFCEENEKCMKALRERVDTHFPSANVEFINGDSNNKVNEIIKAIPKHSKQEKILRFCFADPFSLNLKFSTIERISSVGKIDFLILLALHMDGNRNLFNYISENSTKIDDFINDTNWRGPFKNGEIPDKKFISFLSDKYDDNMKHLQYLQPAKKHLVKIDDINVPLYYLAFYSKHQRGNDFYTKVEKYLSPQQSIF